MAITQSVLYKSILRPIAPWRYILFYTSGCTEHCIHGYTANNHTDSERKPITSRTSFKGTIPYKKYVKQEMAK